MHVVICRVIIFIVDGSNWIFHGFKQSIQVVRGKVKQVFRVVDTLELEAVGRALEDIYICSACVQNLLVVVAIKVNVQVVIFGVVVAFILFCDL